MTKTKRGVMPLRVAGFLLACALPFGGFPPLLVLLPLRALIASLWVLVWAACPLLAIFLPYRMVRAGIPAAAAWLFPVTGYLLLPLWQIRPEWPVILLACVLGIFSGVAAEQRAARRARE